MTRRLGSVEVQEDDQAIMFKESANMTDIYVRESPSPQQLHMRNLELNKFFLGRFNISQANIPLFSSMISAPVEMLGSILATHSDLPLDNGKALEESDYVTLVTDDLAAMSLGGQTTSLSRLQTAELTVDRSIPGTPTPARRRQPTEAAITHQEQNNVELSLVELVPALSSRVETLVQYAQNISSSSILVARLPRTNGGQQYYQPERTLSSPGHSNLNPTADSSSSVSQHPANSPSYVRGGISYHPAYSPSSVRGGTGQGYSTVASRTSFSMLVSYNTSQVYTSSAQEIRTREIGFKGEYFVCPLPPPPLSSNGTLAK
jgi:hypothetical protein